MAAPSDGHGKPINLSDYDYEQEIEDRLLMGAFSALETQVLEELLYSSLKVNLQELEAALDIERKSLDTALETINQIELFQIDGELLTICKEKRKRVEALAERLESDFSPTIQHLIERLSTVPITLLPRWYDLPYTSEEIFQSIIDKYLVTPKKYRRQLAVEEQNNPQIEKLCQLLYSAPDYKIAVADLIKQLSLSERECHELILQLEFHFIGCLTFELKGEKVEPFLSPPAEWIRYLNHENCSPQTPPPEEKNIERLHPSDFGFVSDLNKVLRSLMLEPVATNGLSQELIDTITTLKLATIEEGELSLQSEGRNWLAMTTEEQAMALYFFHLKRYHRAQNGNFSDRDVREIERAIGKAPHELWIEIEEFTSSIAEAIGDAKPVTLQRKGRRWHYELPEYTDLEKAFIKEVIIDHLFKCGMVAIGSFEGKTFFKVTPFGRMTLGN